MSKTPFGKISNHGATRVEFVAHNDVMMGEVVNATQGGLERSWKRHRSSICSGSFMKAFGPTACIYRSYVNVESKHGPWIRTLTYSKVY